MGVNLSPIVEATPVELSDLRGRTVAVDAYNTIFQFLSIIRQPDGRPLCDEQGRTTSQLSGLLYRTANLIENGIEPSFVFDGKADARKADTIKGRIERREKAQAEYEEALAEGDMERAFSKAQQTSRMTPDILESSKRLLGLMGIPVVQAPHDGEAQGAYMCRKGDVYAAASQDFDSVLFGAPVLLRNLTISGRRKMPGKNVYRTVTPEIIDSAAVLESLGVTREQLVDVCIMMGTDFNPGVSGIGPKKGLKLIKKHGTLENVIASEGFDIPDYDEVRAIFLDGEGSDDYSVTPGPMDREGVLDMMTGYGFSEERVKAVLDKMSSSRKAESDRKKQRSLDAWFRSGSYSEVLDSAAVGAHASVDVPASPERPEALLGLLHVAVDLPASDASAASPFMADVPLDVLERIVQEDADLGGHRRAEREARGELGDHGFGGSGLIAVPLHEGHHVTIIEEPLQHPRAVHVDQRRRPVLADRVYRDPEGLQNDAELLQLIADTMKVGSRSEHASALQTRQCRRTMADHAGLQIGHGGFYPPRACL